MTLEELTTLDNLNEAFHRCAKVSHWKESTQRYKANLLVNNLQLQQELRNGTYRVSDTIDFQINERGKIRDIQAPVVRDRIVQKILCEKILIPQLSRSLIYDNYASLKGRGTSFARKRLDVMLRRYIREHGTQGYVLKIDVKKYFDSIDHDVLKRMIRRDIHEPTEIMELIDYIIDTSSDTDKGLNLGAEAPQIFAVYYLSRIDNYIKTICREKYYGRFVDDIIVISDSKEHMKDLLADIEKQFGEIGLEANERKTTITTLKHGFTFLQIKYNLDGRKIIKRPTPSKITRLRRRLKKYKKKYDMGVMSGADVRNAYMSCRNSILKECNRAKRSIYETDKIYKSLFPESVENKRCTREELIQDVLKDKEVLECIQSFYRTEHA